MLASLCISFLLAGAALAQTPTGFAPNVTAHLDVIFGTTVVTPGLALTKSATSSRPTIGTDEPLKGTFIFFMIDQDVPGALVGGPAGSRTTNLHAFITGWTSASTATNGVYILTTKDTGPVAYVAPAPPAETPKYAHKYVQVLFQQPAGFAVPSSQTAAVKKGIGFNITSFVADAKLAPPVRGNYFTEAG